MRQLKRKWVKHAVERAWQRYRVKLNRFSLKRLVRQIQIGESVSLFSLSRYNTLHLVTVEEVSMVAMYNKKSSSIATFLPKQACFRYVERGRISRRKNITITEAHTELVRKLEC